MNPTLDTVFQTIASRKSVRSFLPTPVDPDLVRRILATAASAPSGSNIQPWRVHVLTGAVRDRLAHDLLQAHETKTPESREYQYYPVNWRSPYLERRRETGWGLYELLGIAKGDRVASARQHGRNYMFFGAPLVMIFAIDDDLGVGSWLDYGMFLQNIMIAARGAGLHTCPQAALANYPDIVKRHLGIPDNQIVVCGISMGYEDESQRVNGYRPARVAVDEFVTFHRHVETTP